MSMAPMDSTLESREVPSKLSSKTKSQPSKLDGGSAKEKLESINENAKVKIYSYLPPKKPIKNTILNITL